MKSITLIATALIVSACGDLPPSIHLTLTGAVATTGGRYEIEIRQVDGRSIDGIGAQSVQFRSGSQDVSLVLESPAVSQLATVRVRVAAHGSIQDGTPLALGSTVVELGPGVVTGTVELRSDPRPFVQNLAVTFPDPALGGDAVRVAGSDLAFDEIESNDHSMHVWLNQAGSRQWLGVYTRSDCADGCDYAVSGGPLLERSDFTIEISAESDRTLTALAAPNGWIAWVGTPFYDTFTDLAALATALDGAAAIAAAAENHANLSQNADTNPKSVTHAEHVHNILAPLGSHADLDDDKDQENPIADDNGFRLYYGDIVDRMDAVIEINLEGGAAHTATLSCLSSGANEVDVALAAAIAVGTDPSASNRQALVTAVAAITGSETNNVGVFCLRRSWGGLSIFSASAP